MTKERAWPVRLMYLLIAAALAMSLIVMAAPAQKATAQDAGVAAEWEKVGTPTTKEWVLAPHSTIIDYALDADGEVAYAVVYDDTLSEYFLLKSDDHAATWEDYTDELEGPLDANQAITAIWRVATDWVDPDFVAVALSLNTTGYIYVFISDDAGTTFTSAKEVMDGAAVLTLVSDLAVSYEAGGSRDMAIGGMATGTPSGDGAGIFRSTVTGHSASAWDDATGHDGWDNSWSVDTDLSDDLESWLVTDIIFSPSWTIDKTVLVTSVTRGLSDDSVFVQSGSWSTSPGWNEKSTLGIEAVDIKENVNLPTYLAYSPFYDARGIAGLLLPSDYNSKTSDTRVLWAWVNYYDTTTGFAASEISRVDDDSAGPVGPMGQIEEGEVWLTNITYRGTIAEGEAMAGLLGDGVGDFSACCDGVQVYRNNGIVNMDICCERWEKACKPPTGRAGMAVSYVGDDKAYAVALGEPGEYIYYDEGAWSVTFDDGDTWNQLSLIDTYIDYVSDVAKSPDCNKTFLMSVNLENMQNPCESETPVTGCDSVWLHAETLHEAEEYNGQWLRTWSGLLDGANSDEIPGTCYTERGLLRLPPEEDTGETVILVDRMSGNVYWNDLETLACWDPIASTEVTHIVDLAAQDADTLFALDKNGAVAKFDEDEWHEAVDGEVTDGWTIAVKGEDIIVGGQDGDASYSDDGGATFTELADVAGPGALVTVAFDTYFDTYFGSNDVIFAALASAGSDNGIYMYTIGGESDAWYKLNAEAYDYTGLVLERPSNHFFTNADTGGVLYASYLGYFDDDDFPDDFCPGEPYWYTGVARSLHPIVECICGVGESEWDYLVVGLGEYEEFAMAPDALEICGCLTADTNSRLFAIDGFYGESNCHDVYNMDDYSTGALWTFEDCYAKKGATLNNPGDGIVVPSDPCGCENIPFVIGWDRLCDACSYDVQFSMDEDFEEAMFTWHVKPEAPETPSLLVDYSFTPEFTYYWRVRAADAETCQWIHSSWSEPRSFTVAPYVGAASLELVAPEPGATSVPLTDVGFSWDLIATWDEFDFILWKDGTAVDTAEALTSTYYQTDATLTYDTTYSWQVTAYNDGVPISTSSIGTFRTMTEAEEPVEPVEAKTPFWVWIVIAIGAVLVIVVIVLIFRTRRV